MAATIIAVAGCSSAPTGLDWSFEAVNGYVLSPGGWADYIVYKSTIIPLGGGRWDLWYSANTSTNEWWVRTHFITKTLDAGS